LTVGEPTLPAEGGSGTIGVSATRECTWTAAVEGSWLTLKSSSNGQGDGTVEFTAAANPDPVQRRGALVLNAQRAELTQQAAQCDIRLAEISATFAPAGGNGRVDVRASSALCSWNAVSTQSWIAIRSGADGKGNGTVVFDVAATSGPPRTGTVTIAGQSFSVLQSEGCTYAIAPQRIGVSPEGGTGVVTVTTAPECPWTASSNDPWVVFARGGGTGPGTVNFTVQPTDGPARTGTAVIAGQTFTVTQSQGCTYQVRPLVHAVAAAGGAANVNVTAGAGCPWNAISDVPWITIQGLSPGSGSGVVTFGVAPTQGPTRSGSLTVAGQKVVVNQSQGCTYSISPTQATSPAAGGNGQVTVTTDAGCAWTATSAVPWITIPSGPSGSGAGVLTYAVASTTGPARSGTLQIAGQTFTVNQGQGCTVVLSPTSATVPAAGGQAPFSVQTASGCAWTASAQEPWLAVPPATGGNGNGNVLVTVGANTGPARTGTVTAGGQTFTVAQESGCVFTINPTSATIPAAGGGSSVAVSSAAGCAWTAVSQTPWIVVASGASGAGDGVVQLTVEPNATGAARAGTVTIAGQAFTVNQE
jgi:hypothetical protein